MRIATLSLAIGLLSFTSNAQNHEWSFQIGGYDFERSGGIDVDAAGNVYVCGAIKNSVDFDPDTSTAILTDLGSNGDIFVAKYDNSGNYIWAFNIGVAGHDNATDIEVDDAGNVYVTGYYEWDVDFDPGPDTSMLYSISWRDIFVAKYNTDGDHLWSFSLAPGGNVDRLAGITLDQNANVIVTGYFQGLADFDPGPGIEQLTWAGSGDIFLAKYDNDGNYIWANSIGGPEFDWGKDVATDNNGNIYLTGQFQNTINLNGGSSSTLTANGGSDVLIAKYDGNGNYVWSHGFGSASTTSDDYDESGSSIATDGMNNVYVAGYASGGDADPGPGTAQLGGGAESDPFFAKYNSSGDLQWAHNISDQDEGKCRGIDVDHSGNVYVTGFIDGSFDFDFGPGTNILVGWDIFIAKYDTDGNHIWAFDAGDSAYDSGFGIAVDDTSNVYTTGVFYGIIDMDPDTGLAEIEHVGGRDVFVSKHSPCFSIVDNVSICTGPYIFPDGTSSDTSTIHASTWLTSFGCDSVIITDLTIVQIDTTVSIIGNTVTSNEVGATYQWLDCDNSNSPIFGETSQSFTASTNGNYAVEITLNGCTKTSDCVFISTVAVLENVPVNLKVFPNPFNGILNLEGGLSQIVAIEILDAIGRSLSTHTVTNTIDLGHLENGPYLLRLLLSDGSYILSSLIKN